MSNNLYQWSPENIEFYATLFNISRNSLGVFYKSVLASKNDEKLATCQCEAFDLLITNETHVLSTVLELLKRFCATPKYLAIPRVGDIVDHCASSVESLVALLQRTPSETPRRAMCTLAVAKLIGVMSICMDTEGMGGRSGEKNELFSTGTREFLTKTLFSRESSEVSLISRTTDKYKKVVSTPSISASSTKHRQHHK